MDFLLRELFDLFQKSVLSCHSVSRFEDRPRTRSRKLAIFGFRIRIELRYPAGENKDSLDGPNVTYASLEVLEISPTTP